MLLSVAGELADLGGATTINYDHYPLLLGSSVQTTFGICLAMLVLPLGVV